MNNRQLNILFIMISSIMRTILLVAFLAFGMNIINAQTTATPDPSNYAWKSNAAASAAVQLEIQTLTTQIAALKQQGGPAQLIGKLETELAFWQYLKEALAGGLSCYDALVKAFAMIGGGADAAENHPFLSLADFDALYQKALSKMTN